MSLVKVKEIIGISEKSFDDALLQIVKQISSQKQNVSGIKIIGWTVDIKNGQISAYKVDAKYAYSWEKELHE